MRFKVDENLPVEAAKVLRQAGYDATTVQEQQLSGSADSEIAEICRQEERVIMTLDTDFSDIRAYPPGNYAGLIVLRLKRQDKPYVLRILRRLIPLFSKETLKKHLWIVEESRVRIRD